MNDIQKLELDHLKEPATEFILQERHRFDDIYKTIETYSKNKGIIIGGMYSVKTLLSEERRINDFEYDLYCEDALNHAFEMSKQMVHYTKAIMVQTNVYNEEFTIMVQGRPMVRLYRLNSKLRDIIQPMKWNSNVYIPPDYHLIQMYRELYQPIPDNWEVIQEYEPKLYKMLHKKYHMDPKKFLGGNRDVDIEKIRIELRDQLLEFLASRTDIVLVGEIAIQILLNSQHPTKENNSETQTTIFKNIQTLDPKIQAITILGHDGLELELSDWIGNRSKLPTIVKQSSVNLLSDFRLTRTIISIIHETNIPVLYIYNSLDYDLIPFNSVPKNEGFEHHFVGGQIGNPWVLMRFILIGIWLIKIIREYKGIDKTFALEKMKELYQWFFIIRDQSFHFENLNSFESKNAKESKNSKESKRETGVWKVFQEPDFAGSKYAGIYYPDLLAKKEFIKTQKTASPFYPAALDSKKKLNF